jgi:DNA-binding cell septation regulator SpoVG
MLIKHYNHLDPQIGKIVAFFELEVVEGITIQGMKLIDGTNGLFIAPPAQKGKGDKYNDIIVLSKSMRQRIHQMIMPDYNLKEFGVEKEEIESVNKKTVVEADADDNKELFPEDDTDDYVIIKPPIEKPYDPKNDGEEYDDDLPF